MNEKVKNFNNFILIYAFGGALIAITTYFIFKSTFQKTGTSQNPPAIITSTESFDCRTDSNCVIGIKPEGCCPCPQAISANEIGNEGWKIYLQEEDYSKQRPEECDRVDCIPCETPTIPVCSEGQCTFANNNTAPQITEGELGQGWYWGFSDQKKSGTPSDWMFKNAGRSSCWHKPGVDCATPASDSKYVCPEGGWVNCMPVQTSLDKCSNEAQQWYENNCPDFEGIAY